MKKTLIIFFALLFPFYSEAQNIKSSIVRLDNDYVTYEDIESSKESTPGKMLQRYYEVLNKKQFDMKNGTAISYKIVASDTLCVYVLLVSSNMTRIAYFFCYNPRNEAVTKDPAIINYKWAFNNEEGFSHKLMDYPLVSVNEQHMLYLKERVHNGNVYNAVMTKAFSIKEDLSLSLEFCYESSAILPDKRKIKRILDGNAILAYELTDRSCTYLGKTIIDMRSHSIISKVPQNNNSEEMLFTSSGKDDEEILKRGYSFWY